MKSFVFAMACVICLVFVAETEAARVRAVRRAGPVRSVQKKVVRQPVFRVNGVCRGGNCR